jgi:hypothetical protein
MGPLAKPSGGKEVWMAIRALDTVPDLSNSLKNNNRFRLTASSLGAGVGRWRCALRSKVSSKCGLFPCAPALNRIEPKKVGYFKEAAFLEKAP